MLKSAFFLPVLCFLSQYGFAFKVAYQLSMSNPNSHYFEVKMDISDIKSKQIDLKMPVWAPGSYLVREFPKAVNLVKVKDQNGNPLDAVKTDKNTWCIQTAGVNAVVVNYEVYSFELSVRTNFLDDSHGYLNGSATFMYVDGYKDLPGTLQVVPHSGFSTVSTSLKENSKWIYRFANYDELADSPIEIGNQKLFSFTAAGVKHTVCMYGEGNYDAELLKRDMAKIVEAETQIFGENPNDEYLFIVHNITNSSGGLEHKSSTTLQVYRWGYDGDGYLDFLNLVAHEYFHLWNVKRLRPKELGPFDYDKENYTDLLWVMEGFTSYYDELIMRRAGFYTNDEYLTTLTSVINYVENSIGNKVQPVAHSSFDAWIKSYRRNENSGNTEISYYSKGKILAALLDVYIISKSNTSKCLDDFMKQLYTDFYLKGDVGFTEEEFQSTLEKFLAEDMNWFFDQYVYDTQTPDYRKFFQGVGMNFNTVSGDPVAHLGARISGSCTINGIDAGSAAETGGLSVNDEILAINGFRVDKAAFDEFLAGLSVGDSFEILLSRDRVLKTYTIAMGSRKPLRYQFDQMTEADSRASFWLRQTIH